MRGTLLAAAVLSTGLLIAAGCGAKREDALAPASRPAPPVQVKKAELRDLTRRAVYTGLIEPVRVARAASPVEGPIVECAVREGDRVAKDQRLARIGRSDTAQSGLEAARAEWRRQEADFKRVEQLVNSGSLPGEQIEIARAGLKRAEAQVTAAETSAADYDISAPWDGVVLKVWVSEGNYVAPRAPLVDIYDPTSLRVRFFVPEQDGRFVTVGSAVRVTLDAWPGRVFEARIERIYPQLEPTTRTLTVEAGLSADVTLLSGLFARVETPLETVAGAVTIPNEALLILPNGEAVVFVAQNEKASRRLVKTGLEAGGQVQIVEGVAPGEEVIVRGQESLRDGAGVRITGLSSDKTPAGAVPAAAAKEPAS